MKTKKYTKFVMFISMLMIVAAVLAACGGRTAPPNNEGPPHNGDYTEPTPFELHISAAHADLPPMFENQHSIAFSTEANGTRLFVWANAPMTDVSLIIFTNDWDGERWIFEITHTIGMVDTVNINEAVVISGFMGLGTLPSKGIAFTDASGARRYFAIQQDNSMGLEPSPFDPDFLNHIVNEHVYMTATNGAGGRWSLGYAYVNPNTFDPETWFIENSHLWAEHAYVLMEITAQME